MATWPNTSFETASGSNPIDAAGWTLSSYAQGEHWAVVYVDGTARRFEAFDWLTLDVTVEPATPAVINTLDVDGANVETFGALWTGIAGYAIDLANDGVEAATTSPAIVTRSVVTGLPMAGYTYDVADGETRGVAAQVPPLAGLAIDRYAVIVRYRHPQAYDAAIYVHDTYASTEDPVFEYTEVSTTDATTLARAYVGGPVVGSLSSSSVFTFVLVDNSGLDEGGTVGEIRSGSFLFYSVPSAVETFDGWTDDVIAIEIDAFDDSDLESYGGVLYPEQETFDDGWGENELSLSGVETAQAIIDGLGTIGDLLEVFTAQPKMLWTVSNLGTDTLTGVTPTIGNPATLGALVTLEQVETPLPAPLAAGVPYVVSNVSGSTFKLTTDGATVVDITQLGAGTLIADQRYFWTDTLEGFY